MAAAIPIVELDMNGECFILGSSGEVQEYIEPNVIIMPPDYIRPAAWGHKTPVSSVQLTAVENRRVMLYLSAAFWLNLDHLTPNVQNAGFIQLHAVAIAYLRMLIIREGLVDAHELANTHHCSYSHIMEAPGNESIKYLAGLQTAVAYNLGGTNAVATANDLQNAQLYIDATANLALLLPAYHTPHANDAATNALLTNVHRGLMRKGFTDVICLVAYMFRVRAHHYLDDMEDRYQDLWQKCLKPDRFYVATLPWKYVATYGVHCIYPDDLDAYWIRRAQANQCAGTLVNRLDSLPAGCASIAALRAGITDLTLCLPKIVEQMANIIAYVDNVETQLKAARWGGSVNHNLYGAQLIKVDEKQLGALASFIMSATIALASSSPLKNSKALKRLADTAPITGAVLNAILSAMLSDKDEIKGLLAMITL